ncbi:MAG: peptidylprolyl isomerase [Chloroflexi bacterium]|nr:peptidylprolyl isomerase [Chloroflexota bacterium]
MTTAQSGDTVTVHYTGTLDDGTVFDSSHGREPLVFTLGGGQVIQGFEEAVIGMRTGETRRTTITAENAYGAYHDELVFSLSRDELPPQIEPAIGEQYQMRRPDGQTFVVTVRDVSPSDITFDANHPLAGAALTFDIELVSIG